MFADSIYFRGHRCFKKDWVGFDTIKPINVIIGRNNVGKSHLLDLVAAICGDKIEGRGWVFFCRGVLDEVTLRKNFESQFWNSLGKQFVNERVSWEIDEGRNIVNLTMEGSINRPALNQKGSAGTNEFLISQSLKNVRPIIKGKAFRRVLADRDIRREKHNSNLYIDGDGRGATNTIRHYTLTANPKYPRAIIQEKLLSDLNGIFSSDGTFLEIEVKHHDGDGTNEWEVYLKEAKKGAIPLSNSGSGLKTILLVLLNLLVVPEFEGKSKASFTFAFEELENNLHPALLRRLLQYLENYAIKEKAIIFLTTHSSVALDLFGASENAQIIHVTHDGESARVSTVAAHFGKLGVISELGAKPSDLLQANGIIWVEGPSDRIYINKWLEIFTDGKLREGRDYQCVFYGGSLLARTQVTAPEQVDTELVNLMQINPNLFVVCDSDKSSDDAGLKERVKRVYEQVQKAGNATGRTGIWVTEPREIENYVPGEIWSKLLEEPTTLPDPEKHESFFPKAKSGANSSFMEKCLKLKSVDKMELAILSTAQMSKEAMFSRFDWAQQMENLVAQIQSWNR